MVEGVYTLQQFVDHFPARYDAAELLAETEKQVRKDLKAGSLNAPAVATPQELHAAVKGIIAPLYSHHREHFMQVVYRVDLSEKMMRPVVANSGSADEAMDKIAVMIIYRCFQKVMARKYFK